MWWRDGAGWRWPWRTSSRHGWVIFNLARKKTVMKLCHLRPSNTIPTLLRPLITIRALLGLKTPKSDQAKCHAPFSSREHVGSIMSNMSFHDDMSRHVVMSCHVVTLETDPCVCHCQYSPTHVKDQNPCLCVKGQLQHSRPPPLSKVWLENAQIRPSKVPRPLFIPRACR